jgi:hypothetical protein
MSFEEPTATAASRRMAPAATVDRRRYPDARLPDVLVDGLGGRCKSKARTSALGGSPLNLFSEVVATLIKVRFYGMSALHPKNGHRQLDRPCPKSATNGKDVDLYARPVDGRRTRAISQSGIAHNAVCRINRRSA